MSDTVTTMSSREFNNDTGRAKRAAENGLVFIETRGTVSHVLMSKKEFDRRPPSELLSENGSVKPRSPVEALADNSLEGDFEFEIPEFKSVFKGVGFD